jgi:hypothetical protein
MPALTGRALAALLFGVATVTLTGGLAAAQAGPTTTSPAPVTTTPTVPPTTLPAQTAPPASEPTTPTTTEAEVPSTPKAATQSGSDQFVLPFVECSFRDPDTNKYNTVWGYATSRDRTIPIGSSNKFSGSAQNAGQPTEFRAGIQHNVFVVTHSGSSTWTLTGLKATAPDSTKTCEANPVPIAAGSWAGLVTLAVVTLLLGTLLWWRMRRRSGRA